MIHKITLRGYVTGSPFKLMYLADEDGISDLAEAYPVLLLLPLNIEKSVLREKILEWASSVYSNLLHKQKDQYLYRYWKETETEYKKRVDEKEKNVLQCKELVNSTVESLTPIIDLSSALIVPIPLTKDKEIRYLMNTKSGRCKSIYKIEKNLQEAISNKNWGGWYATQEDFYRKSMHRANYADWLNKAKLIVNSEIKRHPCVMCPNATEALNGGCALGGSTCSENLSKIFKEKEEC